MRHAKRLLSRTDGFTMVEVIVAVAILFSVVTAVLGLVTVTADLSGKAKRQTALVDAANSYIEQVRSLPFDQIGTGSGTPPGVLAAQTVTQNGITIQITPSVDWVSDAFLPGGQVYKRLTIAVVGTDGNARTARFNTVTYIRNVGQEDATSTLPPLCDFGPLSPTGDGVVYGVVQLDASATALQLNGEIRQLAITCDTTAARTSAGGLAYWTPGTRSVYQTFFWDTTYRSGGVTYSPDGLRTMTVFALDNLGQQASITRRYLVDNYPPSPVVASTLNASATTNVTSTLSWTAAMDGDQPANHYMLTYERQPAGAVGVGDAWTADGQTNDWPATSCYKTTVSFSRYRADIEAHSANPLNRRSSSVRITRAWISRPLAAGTYKNRNVGSGGSKATRTDVTITASAPTFPYTSLAWDVYRSTNVAAWGAVYATGVTLPYHDIYSNTAGWNKTPVANYYKMVARVVPSGWDGGRNEVVDSNAMGPVGATMDTTITMGVSW